AAPLATAGPRVAVGAGRRAAAGLRALLQPPLRLRGPPLASAVQEPGGGGRGVLPELRPLHRGQPAGGGDGAAAVGLLLVELPALRAGRGGRAVVGEPVVRGAERRRGAAAGAVAGVPAGRGRQGGGGAPVGLGDRRWGLSASAAVAAGACAAAAAKPAGPGQRLHGGVLSTTPRPIRRTVNCHLCSFVSSTPSPIRGTVN